MKNIPIILLALFAFSFTQWQPDFEVAKKNAKEKHKLILLNFSGSDWCGPCMRMRKEIFDSETFSATADSLLVMVNADFPRNKKNQLSKTIVQQNEKLADKYNPMGNFPLTLLLDADGKVLKTWDGLPDESAAAFAAEVKNLYEAAK